MARDAPVIVSIPTAVAEGAPAVLPATSAHGRVLEQLTSARTEVRAHNGIAIPLPDTSGWDEVDFLLVPSVVSVQYGDASDFHAILGAFVVHVANPSEAGACDRSFVAWAGDWLDAFDVHYERERDWVASWTHPDASREGETAAEVARIPILGADILGEVATLVVRGTFECAYAVYPAWKNACLAVGVAIPNRDAAPQARALRDRFVREILPEVRVNASTPPPEERH
jgi:hypothetical protein